jgi:hypothetical protein
MAAPFQSLAQKPVAAFAEKFPITAAKLEATASAAPGANRDVLINTTSGVFGIGQDLATLGSRSLGYVNSVAIGDMMAVILTAPGNARCRLDTSQSLCGNLQTDTDKNLHAHKRLGRYGLNCERARDLRKMIIPSRSRRLHEPHYRRIAYHHLRNHVGARAQA